jgi:hypothetical protein
MQERPHSAAIRVETFEFRINGIRNRSLENNVTPPHFVISDSLTCPTEIVSGHGLRVHRPIPKRPFIRLKESLTSHKPHLSE